MQTSLKLIQEVSGGSHFWAKFSSGRTFALLRPGDALLHLTWRVERVYNGGGLLQRIRIGPLCDRRRLERSLLEFFLVFLSALTHLDEEYHDNRNDKENNNRDEDDFEKKFH